MRSLTASASLLGRSDFTPRILPRRHLEKLASGVRRHWGIVGSTEEYGPPEIKPRARAAINALKFLELLYL